MIMEINLDCRTLYGIILKPYLALCVEVILALAFQALMVKYVIPKITPWLKPCAVPLYKIIVAPFVGVVTNKLGFLRPPKWARDVADWNSARAAERDELRYRRSMEGRGSFTGRQSMDQAPIDLTRTLKKFTSIDFSTDTVQKNLPKKKGGADVEMGDVAVNPAHNAKKSNSVTRDPSDASLGDSIAEILKRRHQKKTKLNERWNNILRGG